MGTLAPNDRKMRELILLVARASADDPRMGAVKLNKALFHIDFAAYRDLGTPVTAHPYRKLDEGPAPKYFTSLRADLIDEGAAHLEGRDVGMDNPMHVLVADREADTSVFSAEELAIVQRVLEGMRNKSGAVVSRESHELIGWQVADLYEEIPYETAFLVEPDQADIDRGRELARQYGWGA